MNHWYVSPWITIPAIVIAAAVFGFCVYYAIDTGPEDD